LIRFPAGAGNSSPNLVDHFEGSQPEFYQIDTGVISPGKVAEACS